MELGKTTSPTNVTLIRPNEDLASKNRHDSSEKETQEAVDASERSSSLQSHKGRNVDIFA